MTSVCKQLQRGVTLCQPSVLQNNWKTRHTYYDADVYNFLVRRHGCALMKDRDNKLCIGVFHVTFSEQMATQPIVP